MTSRFDALSRKSMALVMSHAGESTRVYQLADSDSIIVVDLYDAAFETVTGIVDDEAASTNMRGDRSSDQDRATIKVDLTVVTYAIVDLTAKGVTIAQRQIIRLVERPGQPWCEVVDTNDDGFGGLAVVLRKLNR